MRILTDDDLQHERAAYDRWQQHGRPQPIPEAAFIWRITREPGVQLAITATGELIFLGIALKEPQP